MPLPSRNVFNASRDGGANPRPSSEMVRSLIPRSASCRRTRAPAGVASCSANQLLCELVHAKQRLALGGVHAAAIFSRLRNGQAETARQHPHRFGEAHFLVQLDELDHVAADAAAEAVEEALLAVDVERRRLLAVERAQPFPRRAGLPQRHNVPHDRHDVGVKMKIVDEGLRKERHHVL